MAQVTDHRELPLQQVWTQIRVTLTHPEYHYDFSSTYAFRIVRAR